MSVQNENIILIGEINYCDYIPVISSFQSLQAIFNQCVPAEEAEVGEHAYAQIADRSLFREVILLLPFLGNIIILFWDLGNWIFSSSPESLIQENGLILRNYPQLQNNPEIVKIAVESKPAAIQFASDELQANDEILDAALVDGYEWLSDQNLPNEIREIKPLFLRVVAEDGNYLEHASETLKNDADVVKAATLQSPSALLFASEELQEDQEILLAIADNVDPLLSDISSIADHHPFFAVAVKRNPSILDKGSPDVKNNQYIVRRAMKKEVSAFQFAGDKVRNNQEFILDFIDVNWEILNYLPEDLKKDQEIWNKIQSKQN